MRCARELVEEVGVGEALRRREDDLRPAGCDRRLGRVVSSAPTALLSCTASMPSSRSLSHWSFISAISGETTSVAPGSSSAGSW